MYFLLKYIYFLNYTFRPNGFASSLFSNIKSPNAQQYSTIIQGMAKYNQVKYFKISVNIFKISLLF